jgi:hypothetical protein
MVPESFVKGVDYRACTMASPVWSYLDIRNETSSPICFSVVALRQRQKWEDHFLKAGAKTSGFIMPDPSERYEVNNVIIMVSDAAATGPELS